MMVEMDEFKDGQINLLIVNTPLRDYYKFSDKALKRINHVNVYDSKDPIQIRGGKTPLIQEIPLLGEVGSAERTFKHAKNIEVDNPQGIFGDSHNSHNRVNDWIHKTKKQIGEKK